MTLAKKMKNDPNIIGVCNKCTDKRLSEFQKQYPDFKPEINSFCKIGLRDGEKTEWAWVFVTTPGKVKSFGFIDNNLILVENWRFGDPICFENRLVADYIEPDE